MRNTRRCRTPQSRSSGDAMGRSIALISPIFRALVGLGILVLAAGCLGESPTGETWKALESQCLESEGEWRTYSDCPTICWPLEPTADACDLGSEMGCAAVCGEQPSCTCPAERPFWEEGVGCVGLEACDP